MQRPPKKYTAFNANVRSPSIIQILPDYRPILHSCDNIKCAQERVGVSLQCFSLPEPKNTCSGTDIVSC